MPVEPCVVIMADRADLSETDLESLADVESTTAAAAPVIEVVNWPFNDLMLHRLITIEKLQEPPETRSGVHRFRSIDLPGDDEVSATGVRCFDRDPFADQFHCAAVVC